MLQQSDVENHARVISPVLGNTKSEYYRLKRLWRRASRNTILCAVGCAGLAAGLIILCAILVLKPVFADFGNVVLYSVVWLLMTAVLDWGILHPYFSKRFELMKKIQDFEDWELDYRELTSAFLSRFNAVPIAHSDCFGELHGVGISEGREIHRVTFPDRYLVELTFCVGPNGLYARYLLLVRGVDFDSVAVTKRCSLPMHILSGPDERRLIRGLEEELIEWLHRNGLAKEHFPKLKVHDLAAGLPASSFIKQELALQS